MLKSVKSVKDTVKLIYDTELTENNMKDLNDGMDSLMKDISDFRLKNLHLSDVEIQIVESFLRESKTRIKLFVESSRNFDSIKALCEKYDEITVAENEFSKALGEEVRPADLLFESYTGQCM